jgi:hypothetical protein
MGIFESCDGSPAQPNSRVEVSRGERPASFFGCHVAFKIADSSGSSD